MSYKYVHKDFFNLLNVEQGYNILDYIFISASWLVHLGFSRLNTTAQYHPETIIRRQDIGKVINKIRDIRSAIS